MEGFKFGGGGKPSRGVSKDAKPKNRLLYFFQLYFRKFWMLMVLNALYLICCIPVITFGPATSAFFSVLKKYSLERPVFFFTDFFSAFKKNFKQSFAIGIVDVALIAVLVYSIIFYGALALKNPLYLVLLVFAAMFVFIVLMMHFYIYLMIVSTNLKMKDIIKNSLILAVSQVKLNVITLVSMVIIDGLCFAFFPYTMVVIPLIPLSLVGFIITFNSYPVIRKYIIQPYYDKLGELNPEFEYLYGKEDEEDVTFKDATNKY